MPTELPNGSSVCRAPNGTGTSKVVGKRPFPSPTKGRVDLFPSPNPQCPESALRGHLPTPLDLRAPVKGSPLPPACPFLDCGTCKVPSHPQRKL